MDFIYFLVTGSEAWEPRYHDNFFNAGDGFMWGVIGALIIGVVFACIFYFGFCNSKKSNPLAKLYVWGIGLLLCGVTAYFYGDLGVIGSTKTHESLIFKTSFYQANVNYFNKATQASVSETTNNDLSNTLNTITSNLDKGGDVRFEYDITTAALAIIFFYLFSLFVKRFTIAGKTIPSKKP